MRWQVTLSNDATLQAIVMGPDPGDTGVGWVYNNETLEKWFELPGVDAKVNKRPNANGAFGLGRTFTNEARPIITGKYFGSGFDDAMQARLLLNALFADGKLIRMSVRDADDASNTYSERTVWLLEASTRFVYDMSYFTFDVAVVAPDPARHRNAPVQYTGLASASTGLVWPLNSGSTYFDWGTAGSSGRITIQNIGNASMYPSFETGPSSLPTFDTGFRITEVETGRELTFERPLGAFEVVRLNSRTQRATLSNDNGSNFSTDVTAFLSSRDWFELPPNTTRQYQLTSLGGAANAPGIFTRGTQYSWL